MVRTGYRHGGRAWSGRRADTTYAVAEHLDQRSFSLRRGRLVPTGGDGEPIEVSEPDDVLNLEVESAFADGQTLAFKGWAADVDATALADQVLVFADGRQIGAASRRERPDLVTDLGIDLLQAGFEKVLAADQVPRGADLAVVAVFGDRAVAVEIEPDR